MWGRALILHTILHSTFISVLSAERLSDFTIAVGNEFDRDSFKPRRFTRCARVSGAVGQAESRTVKCDVPVVGQYVTVYSEYVELSHDLRTRSSWTSDW